MSCGCADLNCTCNFAAGTGLTLDGNGTKSNPFVYTATGGGAGLVNTADTSSLVWTKNGSGTPEDPVVLSANVAVSIPVPSVQQFINSGTWTKPGGVTRVKVIAQGGGGGGSGGPKLTSPTDFRFAQGGSGGFYTVREFAAADVPASVAVTVGAAATGGAGATTAGNGANGGTGATASFGTLLSAAGGAGGTNSSNAAQITTAPSGGGIPGLAPAGGGYGGGIGYGGTTVTGVRTNLITNPNFETNIAGWTAGGGGSAVAHAPPQGAAMLGALTLRLTGSSASFLSDCFNSQFIPVTPGLPYTFSMIVQRNNSAGWTGAVCRVYIDYYTATSSTSSIQSITQINVTNPDVNYNFTRTITPPDGITRMKLHFQGDSGRTQLSTTALFFDGLLFEQASSALPYFDGSTPDTATVDYAWTGTANASTSTATTVAGLQTFYPGGRGGDVPAANIFGGAAGAGGGTGTSSSTVGVGGDGISGTTSPQTTKPGGSGGGGGGAGSTPGTGGAGGAGAGGGGGAAGITPQNGARGGDGGKGFVTVIAW